MNPQKISPQGYNINVNPMNKNPFWVQEQGGGGNVPPGGTAGQVLTKRTNADYDTEWKTPESGGGSGGGGADWPSGGTDGDLLAKLGTGAEWVTPDYATGTALGAVEAKADAAQAAAAGATNAVTTETARAKAAEQAIAGDVSKLSGDFGEYVTSNDAAVKALNDAITLEQTTRADAINTLTNRVSTVESDLSDYKSATNAELETLNSEDARLDGLISDEADARSAADLLLTQDYTSAVTTERTARQDADEALRTLITGVSGDVDDQTALLTAMDARITKNADDIDTLESNVSGNAKNIEGLGTRMTTAESDIDAVEASVSSLSSTVGGIHGIPSGGDAGKVLKKKSDTDYDVEWGDANAANGLTPFFDPADPSKELPFDPLRHSPDDGYTYDLLSLYNSTTRTIDTRWFEKKMEISSQHGAVTSSSFPYGSTITVDGFNGFDKNNVQPPRVYVAPRYGLTKATNPATIAKGSLLAAGTPSGSVESGLVSEADITNTVAGGTTGQVLTKNSNSDYDWSWKNASGGGSLPSGGTAGQPLVKNSSTTGDVKWGDVPASAAVFNRFTDGFALSPSTPTGTTYTPWTAFGADSDIVGAPFIRYVNPDLTFVPSDLVGTSTWRTALEGLTNGNSRLIFPYPWCGVSGTLTVPMYKGGSVVDPNYGYVPVHAHLPQSNQAVITLPSAIRNKTRNRRIAVMFTIREKTPAYSTPTYANCVLEFDLPYSYNSTGNPMYMKSGEFSIVHAPSTYKMRGLDSSNPAEVAYKAAGAPDVIAQVAFTNANQFVFNYGISNNFFVWLMAAFDERETPDTATNPNDRDYRTHPTTVVSTRVYTVSTSYAILEGW